ncbi:glycogen operon protein GlgX homolog [Kaistia sp. 32K]|uniref:glycogen debranching protein GlgX n=1 Tax=Kaistia sp. 32K TaxID=2795690 RepID=UPI001914F691|nr:glycogen debranching protein GlgX [Kaistia sp. 32K]BCP51874.1 glycogen operon protein GlgX homolog [Kaistia sp. 32K]
MPPDAVRDGSPEPLGVTPTATGVNVAVHSSHAEAVHFCLFNAAGAVEIRRIRLPARTGDVHHGEIDGIMPGDHYGLRAEGPWSPETGQRFNLAKLLVDPYALALDRPFALHDSLFDARRLGEASDARDSAAFVPKAIVTGPLDRPAPRLDPPVAWDRQVIYELHVRGFSKLNPAVPEAMRGSFAGLGHPASIAHLKRLGVTTVELLPVAAWLDERHLPPLGLSNYWGYNPIAWMAPDPRLAPGGFAEVAAAVAALHQAGIAVILDVVFNHSGESDHLGPTVSMRGLDNATYYRLEQGDPSGYVNDAGTGNILACDRPPVLRLVMDALRTWVERAGVDGFRFDLATTLARREDGFDPAAPLLAAIEQDPLLRDVILIAEPWDIGPGGYQLGQFPAGWGEWNDSYRDTVRRFFRGDAGMIGDLATRLAGSADVFAPRHRGVDRSINFVTAHDGFTLADLVAHEHKHNEANGEANRDGTDDNKSWNNGVEGETADAAILARRGADVRALLMTLIVSRGTPMLSMGDELGRSQRGNNNAYAQDNAVAWLDWSKADPELIDFTAELIALRAAHPALRGARPLTGTPTSEDGIPDVLWIGADGLPLRENAWSDPAVRTLGMVLDEPETSDRLCLLLNGGGDVIQATLPPARAGRLWRKAVESLDFGPADEAFAMPPRSAILLVEAVAE